MARVELVDGTRVHARLTKIRHVGEEGSRSALAHIGDATSSVYNSLADGITDIWSEQVSFDIARGTTRIVEGSATPIEDGGQS